MKTQTDSEKIKAYIDKAAIFLCKNCNASILRLRKVKCPFCGQEMEKKEA